MAENHNSKNKSKYWERMTKKGSRVFAIGPIIPHLIIIAIVWGIYYYIVINNYFPEWPDYIYWGTKIIIGFEILAASARSLWGPILGVIAGVVLLFTIQVYDISLITTTDAWQIIAASLVGFLVTIIIKL
jgi:hypothetical protein